MYANHEINHQLVKINIMLLINSTSQKLCLNEYSKKIYTNQLMLILVGEIQQPLSYRSLGLQSILLLHTDILIFMFSCVFEENFIIMEEDGGDRY